jgi:hypothetical protein
LANLTDPSSLHVLCLSHLQGIQLLRLLLQHFINVGLLLLELFNLPFLIGHLLGIIAGLHHHHELSFEIPFNVHFLKLKELLLFQLGIHLDLLLLLQAADG